MSDEFGNVVDASGRHAASPGLDHPWFSSSSVASRPPLMLPNGAAIALSVLIDLTAVEWEQPNQPAIVPPPGGRGTQAYPDVPRMSHREYGHRTGVFRLLEAAEDLNIRPAVIIDVLTVEQYAPLLEHLDGRVAEYLAGGLSASRAITSRMSIEEERHYIGSTLDRLEGGLGVRLPGWVSPQRSESTRTPRLLAEAGVRYVGDWGNDEQPYPFEGEASGVWSFPLSWELSDESAMFLRKVSPSSYARALTDAHTVMKADGASSARVLGLHLHPWLTGQPFRINAVSRALERIVADDGTWLANPGEVVDWCTSSAV